MARILWAGGNSSLELRLKVTTEGVSLKVNSSEEGAEPTEPSLLSSWPQMRPPSPATFHPPWLLATAPLRVTNLSQIATFCHCPSPAPSHLTGLALQLAFCSVTATRLHVSESDTELRFHCSILIYLFPGPICYCWSELPSRVQVIDFGVSYISLPVPYI